MRTHERGQVLILFALMLTVILGMLAIAIDVSSAYSARRAYRTAADAAALAGGQDLQQVGSRTVNGADRCKARQDALKSLWDQQHATGTPPAGGCGTGGLYDSDLTDYPLAGTPFIASIKTPVTSCVMCDLDRSIQVGLANPTFGLTFSRVFGMDHWNVGVSSVAGLTFEKSFAVITLRPPKKTGSTFDVRDIKLDGGSTVTVQHGDVGSNANMVENASSMILDSGYRFFYYPAAPPDNDPAWVGDPVGVPHTTPITDPGYTYPAMAGSLGTAASHTFTTAKTTACEVPPDATVRACTWAGNDPACLAEATSKVPAAYGFMPSFLATPAKIYCYRPGIYDTSNTDQLKVASNELGILLPGVYYFKSGLTVSGRLIGGYEANSTGVALMFDEVGPGNNGQNIFSGNNALTISLNAGSKYPATATGGTPASAAIDWNNQLVQTSGPDGPDPAILMTLLVKKDTNGVGGSQGCTVPTSGTFIEPIACDAQKNQTVQIAGNGSLVLEGVQYMPTDNVAISGNSSTTGRFGQIVSWTLTYSGGIAVNQEGEETQGPGLLRLDGACTAPGTPCTP